MGAFRSMGWLKAPLAGAAWAALGLGGALAQPPARGVEVWHGLERVSGGPEAPPRPTPPAAPKPAPSGATLAPGVYVLPAASYPFTPSAPPPALLPAGPAVLPAGGRSFSEPLPKRSEAAPPRHGEVLPTAHWDEERPGSKLDSAVHREHAKTQGAAPRRPAPRPEVKAEKPAAAPSPPAPPSAPPAPAAEEKARPAAEAQGDGPSKLLYSVALVQVLSALGSLVVGPLVLLAALLVVLRRYKGAGSLLRVEVVNSGTPAPTIIYGGPAPPPAAGDDGAEARPPAEVGEPETTAQPFDLGLTYEEEQSQREEAERLRERAVLQHVYEDNVRLREQLGQAEGDLTEAVPA